MTFSAALLGTTVRVLRTAAGRRALQLALLVGGLFVLGFLFGEQAHAADGTAARGTATTSVTYVTSVSPLTPSDSGTAAQQHPARTAGKNTVTSAHDVHNGQGAPGVQGVLSTVTGTVSTVNRTVSTVIGTASTVVRTVEGATGRVLPPSLPLPDPAHPAPSPQGQGAGTASRPASPVGTPAPAHPHPHHTRTDARGAAPVPAPFTSYGPEAAPRPAYALHPARTAGSTVAVAGPGRPAPAGTPNGVPGKQATDGTASRHADAYAVTLGHHASLRLVSGTAVRTDAPRTRERHRDIPVFPG
ncbi:hypothetical protein [Streptomyces monashensis]|uniref:Uncharacterized protein n=1 Tax=Streptomyces monashensis TaxID=1678012 RepID=A0A1S2QFL9_9ACTN|nr:hypothetical protein [Streptomyces monashensis]OIK04949.1 hypothetical protein BIV23_14090 [Streptomyces monashensis]